MIPRLFRLYGPGDPLDSEGYPLPWSRIPFSDPVVIETLTGYGIKDAVRAAAGNRCVRCGHPYMTGAHGSGEWSPCDDKCVHAGPVRVWIKSEVGQDRWVEYDRGPLLPCRNPIEAKWRILTVHHLNGNKLDLRWWNLAALCQRCHLTIQGKVRMDRPYDRPHSDWFLPYVAGHYAWKYLGEELDRGEVEARLDELLSLELRQLPLFERKEDDAPR